MNAQQRIAKANAELAAAKEEQSRCCHKWGKPFQDTRTRTEPYGFRTVHQGSDVWTEAEGYHDVPYTVWCRQCTVCGLVQDATHTEPVVTDHRPVFPS